MGVGDENRRPWRLKNQLMPRFPLLENCLSLCSPKCPGIQREETVTGVGGWDSQRIISFSAWEIGKGSKEGCFLLCSHPWRIGQLSAQLDWTYPIWDGTKVILG